MITTISFLIIIIILLHVYFLVLEMFLWDTPYGRKTFRLSNEFATQSKALAANQGLYNGFLAAGLVWGYSQGKMLLSSKSSSFHALLLQASLEDLQPIRKSFLCRLYLR